MNGEGEGGVFIGEGLEWLSQPIRVKSVPFVLEPRVNFFLLKKRRRIASNCANVILSCFFYLGMHHFQHKLSLFSVKYILRCINVVL